uniref:Uncharacterized protein n=1 Tax=Globisporangium ultimum (strain ATCC 200006 / CBS 805.95 / DAOM BR144) TaxID=431595 RepID=K3WDV1_GLOUD
MKVEQYAVVLILNWNLAAVEAFVHRANITAPGASGVPAIPAWLTVTPPNLTANSLTDDIVGHLALVVGGRCGRVMLAPNDLVQYGNVMTRLVHIEQDSFVQACMIDVLANQHLASLFCMQDRRTRRPIPTDHVPPPTPVRSVFA